MAVKDADTRERRILRAREGDPLPVGFWVSALLGHEDAPVGTGTNSERLWIIEVSEADEAPAHLDLEERYQALATACFEAGHYPNPRNHSVTGCAICEALLRPPRGAG